MNIQRRVLAEIRAELGRQNLKRSDLARALGWTQQKAYRRFCGEVPLSLAEIAAIADELGVPPGRFTMQIEPGEEPENGDTG